MPLSVPPHSWHGCSLCYLSFPAQNTENRPLCSRCEKFLQRSRNFPLVTFMVLCYACHGKDLLWFSWFGYLLFYQISWPLPFYFSFFFRSALSVYGVSVSCFVGSLSYFQKMNPKLLSGLGFALFYLGKSGSIRTGRM